MSPNVTLAIFKRNFLAYFTNPTGYVFICLFVLLTALAAFFVDEFWASNLANFDQLNSWFPLIMLLFIPAITMSVWAGERNEGTDEVLLTLPASDLDVVLGKYLSAVAIFTVSLLFSTTNILVLSYLASPEAGSDLAVVGPDYGVILANYVGYWLVGLAMVAIGMAASFLTSNLTIAFILSLLFNTPLVALYWARSVITSPTLADIARAGSIGERFQDFGRGLITLSSVVYFVGIAVALLYVCMVLIGERHWGSTHRSRSGQTKNVSVVVPTSLIVLLIAASLVGLLASLIMTARTDSGLSQWDWILFLLGFLVWLAVVSVAVWFLRRRGEQFLLRILAMIVIVGSLVALAQQSDAALDLSSEQLSTLSPKTRELLTNLRGDSGTVADEPASTETEVFGSAGLRQRDGAYSGAFMRFTSGELRGQVRQILSYDGQSRRFQLDRDLPHPPPAGTSFIIERPPITIEAFISPEVPEEYVQTRLNLLTMLRRFQSIGGRQIQVRVYDTEPASDAAAIAEEQFGITPRNVPGRSRGSVTVREVFLGVAVTSGAQPPVITRFFDRGLSPEYELIRSVATVSQQERRRIGVVRTDVPLFGGFNPMTFQPSEDMPIISELRKQFDVQEVDLSEPVQPGQYDALMAVQPSAMDPEHLDNLLAAIEAGVPTAIFEDPFTYMDEMMGHFVPGTSQPRRNQFAGPFGGGPPPDKGDINKLWRLLGVVYDDQEIVAHTFNPFPRFMQFPPFFVFAGKGSASDEPFNRESLITRDLRAPLLFLFSGSLAPLNSSPLEFTPLVRTGRESGYMYVTDLETRDADPNRFRRNAPPIEYVLAARIQGKPEGEGQRPKIDTVVVADIDMLYPVFFMMREAGAGSEGLDLDNVAFVLNLVDELAGDDRFLDVRTRRRSHRTLARLDEVYQRAFTKRTAAVRQAEADIEGERDQLQEQLDEELAKIRGDQELHPVERRQLEQIKLAEKQRALDEFNREKAQALQDESRAIERRQDREIRQVQDTYKLAAVALPPIPPLIIALIVFLMRRARELQGVNTRRLRP